MMGEPAEKTDNVGHEHTDNRVFLRPSLAEIKKVAKNWPENRAKLLKK